MHPEQIEKLQQLIKSSAILNPQERSDWLALLELMNDKQLRELEKILTVQPEIKAQRPQLRHLMNLPASLHTTFETHKPEYKNQRVSPNKQTTQAGQPQPGKTNGVWQKIKDVLNEKELPAGRENIIKELELPPPNQYQKPKIQGLPRPLVPKPKPTIAFPQKPLVLAEKKQDQNFQPKPIQTPASTVKLEEKLRPGLQLGELRNDIKTAGLFASIKQPLGQMEKAEKAPVLGANPHIGSLKDLPKIRPEDFTKNLNMNWAGQIKALVKTFGYHDVVFSLEQSLLFQAYMNTGRKILSGSTNFSQISQSQAKDTLSQEAFEKFTDLLMEIQTV